MNSFSFMLQYINMLIWPMLACGDAINMFSQGSASIRRVQEVFSEKPEIFDREEAEPVGRIQGDITFSHLTFLHRGHSEPTLKDINLEIPSGTTLAVIGRTGDGKSTLVNLLLHLYQTKPGMILIDGRDINTISLKTLWENISYVPQDNFLFSDTLKANIAFGAPAEDMAAIARALMKDAPILILDDSLSAVDTDTEEQILHNLKQNRKGKTTILIAHRITTIQSADIIMVLEEGMAKEIGNHEALMKKSGIYRALC